MKSFRYSLSGDSQEVWIQQRPTAAFLLLMAWGASGLLQAILPGWSGLLAASCLAVAASLGAAFWGWRGAWGRTLYFWGTAAFFFVGFALNTLLLSLGWAAKQNLLPEDYESIALSFRIGFAGWVAWSIGFLWNARGAIPAIPTQTEEAREPTLSLTALLVLAVAGIGGQFVVGFFLHSQAGNELFGKVGTFFSTVGKFGLIAICAIFATGDRRQRMIALGLLALSAGAGLLTGQRAELFKGILSFIIFLMLRRDNAGQSLRRPTWALAGVVVVFIIFYPALSQYKLMMSGSRQQDSGFDRALLLMETLPSIDRTTVETQQENVSRLLLRLSQVQFGAHLATTGREQWGLLKGRSLYECLIMFVPRLLWRSKPSIGLGQEGYNLLGYPEGTGAITVPIAIDWHLNYEWIGVGVGMFLTGMFVGRMQQLLGGPGLLRNAALAVIMLDICQAGTGLKGVISPLVIFGGGSIFLERYLARAKTRCPDKTPRGPES